MSDMIWAAIAALESACLAPLWAREIRAWKRHRAESQDRLHRFNAAMYLADHATTDAERQAAIGDMIRIVNENNDQT